MITSIPQAHLAICDVVCKEYRQCCRDVEEECPQIAGEGNGKHEINGINNNMAYFLGKNLLPLNWSVDFVAWTICSNDTLKRSPDCHFSPYAEYK